MTAATLSRLPLVAGGTLLGSLGRGGFWTATRLLDVGFWGIGQFMRAPIAISAIVAVVGFSAIAGANALYFQHERHPAPLFFAPPKAVLAPPKAVFAAPRVTPVLPAPRPRLQPAALNSEVTGSIGQEPVAQPITTDDIKALQNKLIALKLLDSAADGIYGPHTAVAVRAFESHAGMRPDGKLTPALLAALRNTALPAPEALPATVAATPVAAAAPVAMAGPVTPVPLAPLPTASEMAAQPVAQVVAPAPVQAAPAATASPAPLAAAAGSAPAAPVVADTAAAPQAAASTNTFAANSSADGGPDAGQPAAAPAAPLAGREDLTASAQGQVDPASAASAGLTAAQRLAAQFGTLPPAATAAEAIPDAAPGNDSQGSTDPALITQIQKGLASLGFLADKIDGVPGEGTAKAIRNFQVFYNYRVTGLATHQLLGLLVQHGATL